jgi:hypothetical protein
MVIRGSMLTFEVVSVSVFILLICETDGSEGVAMGR